MLATVSILAYLLLISSSLSFLRKFEKFHSSKFSVNEQRYQSNSDKNDNVKNFSKRSTRSTTNYSETRPYGSDKNRYYRKPKVLIKSTPTQSDLLNSVKINEEERLQKVIAHAGLASRRQAEQLILDGRVTVNGKLITELGSKVAPKKDLIKVDGRKISLPDTSNIYWIALYKPKSMLSTFIEGDERDSIIDIVPKAKELRLRPVGGLDRDATGLMLLTNEIGWIHPLTHPSYCHRERYDVVISGLPDNDALTVLRKGIRLPAEGIDFPSCDVEILDVDKPNGLTLLDMKIVECTPNQVEKMISAVGFEVVRLKRTEYATVKLKGLKRGSWRELTTTEISQLKESCKSTIKRSV